MNAADDGAVIRFINHRSCAKLLTLEIRTVQKSN